MPDVAIRVENLSKRYRIGLKEQMPDTLGGSLLSWIRSPFSNYRRLRKLSMFSEGEDSEDIIWALKNISFEVARGEVLGIIGHNGAGKTTLLKILAGITEPTLGRAVLNGRISSLLEVGTGFHPDLTGRENTYLNGTILGMTKAEIERKFDQIVDFSGVEKFIDTPVKRYSSGMRVRLAFSVAAHLEPEILLIDEVLAVGDAEFQKKCLGKMGEVAQQGRTVLFVSHNMIAVQSLCQTTLVLGSGNVSFLGDTDRAIIHYMKTIRNIRQVCNLADRIDRKGNQVLKFTRIAICDAKGNEVDFVLSGKDILIRCYYESSKRQRNAKVLVAFNVSDHEFVLSNLNSYDSGHSKLEVYENGFFECKWRNFNLTSGSYNCTIFCSINDEISDWVESAFTINVENGDFFETGKLISRRGSVLIPHSWSSKREL